jgi:hypothetical protein
MNPMHRPPVTLSGEVFKDSLLGALEKRSLAKFLQFAVDWGRINFDNADALTVNEKLLALGKSSSPTPCSVPSDSASNALPMTSLESISN